MKMKIKKMRSMLGGVESFQFLIVPHVHRIKCNLDLNKLFIFFKYSPKGNGLV
jgi:hypothetical protein